LASEAPPSPPPWKRVGAALREALRSGYDARTLRADLTAGVVVGVVALPLSMALAIASGVDPRHGLATAIVAGALIATLGGSRHQVSGPTAAFVAVLVPISARFGLSGLLLATAMAGVILIAMGVAGLGRMIEFVPYPVTTGFTSGIAVVIATLQLKDFLGLRVLHMPEHYMDRLGAMLAAWRTAQGRELAIGMLTIALLVLWPRLSRRVPAPLVALTAAGLAGWALGFVSPDLAVATIDTRFGALVDGVRQPGIPSQPPLPLAPWRLPSATGEPLTLTLDLVRVLAPSAFAIAILGAIESLLSAVVADGMTGHKHDPDAELIAQGAGNLVAPFFGGFAATGAIARTATNIRAGARSPLAALFHSAFVLAAVVLLAPLLGHLPMAALAGMLLVVAWNMGEWRHFVRLLRVSPRSDALVLVTCFLLTVVFDMVVAVVGGILLAALLFMRRMAEVSNVTLVGEGHPTLDEPLPRGMVLYEVAGPLFFGAAQKAITTLNRMERRGLRVVVLDLTAVPAIDATGLVALQSLVERLNEAGIKVILAGVRPQPLRVFARAGWRNRKGRFRIFRSFDRAVALARRTATADAPPPPPERARAA
jgi:sulfate permease, SulP family